MQLEVTSFLSDGSEFKFTVERTKPPTAKWLEDLWLGLRSTDPDGPTCNGVEIELPAATVTQASL